MSFLVDPFFWILSLFILSLLVKKKYKRKGYFVSGLIMVLLFSNGLVFKFVNDKSLKTILKSYLKFKKLDSNWNYINSCSNLDLTNQLSMICPFSTHEKQMLLESKSIDDRYILLLSILENTVKLNEKENQIRH